jgi:small subunit ribosomal protein S5
VVKYTAILACGNYHGVVGYAKAKGPAIPIALQKVSSFFLVLFVLL